MTAQSREVPEYILDRYRRHQTGKYLPGLRERVSEHLRLAQNAKIDIPREVLFMLSVLACSAKDYSKRQPRERLGILETRREALGYADNASWAKGRQAMSRVHKSAVALQAAIGKSTEAEKLNIDQLPGWLQRELAENSRELKRIAEQRIYRTKPDWLLPESLLPAEPAGSSQVALIWWCFCYPYPDGAAELYKLARTWHLTSSEDIGDFITHLFNITKPSMDVRSARPPFERCPRVIPPIERWWIPSSVPLQRIKLRRPPKHQ